LKWNKAKDGTLPDTQRPVIVTNSLFSTVATAINNKLGYWVPVGVEAYPRTTSLKFTFDIVYWSEMNELPHGG